MNTKPDDFPSPHFCGNFRLDDPVVLFIFLMDEETIVLERQARYGTENIS